MDSVISVIALKITMYLYVVIERGYFPIYGHFQLLLQTIYKTNGVKMNASLG